MSDLPTLSPWYQRAWAVTTGWVRSLRTTPLTQPAPRLGISSGYVAAAPYAEQDLRALAVSPTVYAAVTRRALSFTVWPIRVCSGSTLDPSRRPDTIGADKPWVASFYRLLEVPDPADAENLAPVPGELLIAQIVTDLLLVGWCVVLPTLTDAGDVIGLRRLHPQKCRIERSTDGDYLAYQDTSGIRRYRLGDVFLMRLPSWESTGMGELGTGAGSALRPIVQAEETALRQTAIVIAQGGADIRISAKSAATMEMMKDPKNRESMIKGVVQAISVAGRRVFAIGGDIEVSDAGFKPADIQAEKLMPLARDSQLLALGCTPVSVGASSAAANYATAVQQSRTQAQMDEELGEVITSGLLRPLARQFARRAGGQWATRAWRVTAMFDLSQHPGVTYARNEALARARIMQQMGWTAEQAVAAEGIDLPKPEGVVMGGAAAAESKPGPNLGSTKPEPRLPVGSGPEDDPALPAEPRFARDIDDLWH